MEQYRTPNWKENDFDVVLFLFFPDEASCAFRTGLLFSGSCGIRYRQCLLILALWHSVPERASYGTEYAFGAQNRLLGYATHFQRHSVQKTGVSGTEGIFGAQNSLPWYAAHHGYSVQPPLWYGTDHSMLKKAITETTQKNRTNLATCPV